MRVKLLGEDLVAFRDTNGVVGLIGERCPHRGASLFFGINQQCGLMCIYHGWKYDVDGNCADMPSDLPGSTFKEKVHATAYPCWENNGVLWTYMGPAEKQPAYPNFIFNRMPPDYIHAIHVPIYCDYLQSMEGNFDTTHQGTLHVSYENRIPADLDGDQPGTHPTSGFSKYLLANYRYAKVEVQDTEYRFRLIAIRPTPNGNQHVRIACYAFPFYRSGASIDGGGGGLIHVPADDETSFRIFIQCRPNRPFSPGERTQLDTMHMWLERNGKTRRNRLDNDYHMTVWLRRVRISQGSDPP